MIIQTPNRCWWQGGKYAKQPAGNVPKAPIGQLIDADFFYFFYFYQALTCTL